MILTRFNKCPICKIPVKTHKEFLQPVDMFNPTAPVQITGELKQEVLAWRAMPLYCPDHYKPDSGGLLGQAKEYVLLPNGELVSHTDWLSMKDSLATGKKHPGAKPFASTPAAVHGYRGGTKSAARIEVN